MEKIPRLKYLLIVCSVILILTNGNLNSAVHPNGGECGEFWTQNTVQTIKWDTTGLSGYINISIWNINTASYTVIDTNIQASEGEYNWLIPLNHPIGNNFRIKVQKSDDESIYQMSESFFPIYEESMVPVKTTVEESKNKDGIVQVYPNPVKNELNFNIGPKMKAKSVILYDIKGEKILEQQLAENGPYVINTTNLVSGKYLMKIQLKDGSYLTSSFVVNK